jgi:hypothetical protein
MATLDKAETVFNCAFCGTKLKVKTASLRILKSVLCTKCRKSTAIPPDVLAAARAPSPEGAPAQAPTPPPVPGETPGAPLPPPPPPVVAAPSVPAEPRAEVVASPVPKAPAAPAPLSCSPPPPSSNSATSPKAPDADVVRRVEAISERLARLETTVGTLQRQLENLLRAEIEAAKRRSEELARRL